MQRLEGILSEAGLTHWGRCWRDPLFHVLVMAPIPWWLVVAASPWDVGSPLPGAGVGPHLAMVIWYPLWEELLFRGAVQPALARFDVLRGGTLGISGANLVTSAGFAALHVAFRGDILAGLVFFPSLAFGGVRDSTGSLYPAILLHAWYNASLLGAYWLL